MSTLTVLLVYIDMIFTITSPLVYVDRVAGVALTLVGTQSVDTLLCAAPLTRRLTLVHIWNLREANCYFTRGRSYLWSKEWQLFLQESPPAYITRSAVRGGGGTPCPVWWIPLSCLGGNPCPVMAGVPSHPLAGLGTGLWTGPVIGLGATPRERTWDQRLGRDLGPEAGKGPGTRGWGQSDRSPPPGGQTNKLKK